MIGIENKTLVDRYFLKRLAGAGGMGQVYQAWDRHRSSFMAVKVIHDARFVEAFVREAVALKELAHPNIVRFYSVEQDEPQGIAFIVMDWVEGKDVQGLLKNQRGPMGIGFVTQILGGVQKALHYAHTLGVCHCDIKPANIMIRSSDNMAILSDFGLAHVTQEQGGGGTLAYMAPELFTGGKVSVASDIYALGVTLYQLMSGQLPFQAQTQEKMIQEHLYAVPTPLRRFNPSLSEGIAHVIEKALRKDPARRQQTVTQLWEDFSRYAGEGAGPSPTLASGLYGLRGEKARHSINTAGIQLTIGRSKNNHVCLHHPSVSRRHAAIFWKDDRYFVRDYGSTTGTFVNGRKIRPNEPTALRNKDEIRFGIADVFEFRTRKSA